MTEFEALAAQVRRLTDIEELRLLKARYFAWVDGREWNRLRGLFADDCTFTSSARLPDLAGPDDFIAFVTATVEPGRSTHLGFMPRFEFTDDDHATATWSMFDLVERDDPHRPGWIGLGTYVERYRRGEHGWLITSWHLERGATRSLSRPS
ncbi:nuclear transport factor 2 family protein [Dactylosporangium sp. NPDC005572]|uniref:nuclear transport factor 2 family protein n=1 Tax=Dactylosporangium sp. NPDC005572 TaxID=3156889 RepID=UPI0033AE8C0D